MAERWDVIVAGAGPAGATAAALLARQGIRVLLLDRSHFPRPKACAEYLNPGVLTALRRLGLAERVEACAPRYFSGMAILGPRGVRFNVSYLQDQVPLSAASLPRTSLDTALVQHAVDSGAHLREGVIVHGPLRSAPGVAGVSTSTGDLLASLVLAADGVRSVLARALGLQRPARWPRRLGLVTYVRDNGACADGYGRMVVWPGGYCGIAPLPGGRLNIGMVLPAGALQHSPASALLRTVIHSHPLLSDLLSGADPIERVRGMLPVGVRSVHPGARGLLLLGDAAGFFDPFTGEGIFRAIRSAELAAQLIPSFLDGTTDADALLGAYTRSRSSAFRTKSAVTALVQLFVRFPFLLDYALPRLDRRPDTRQRLCNVLGDLVPARAFLNPLTLADALRP